MGEADRKKNMVGDVLHSQKGFSLAELLVTLILVGLIMAAVAGGISMIARSYTKVVDRADAEQLLSTTVSRITDELSFARDYASEPITPADDKKTVDFVSGITGMRVRITTDGDSMHMYYYSSKEPTPDELNQGEIPLVDKQLKERMTINFNTIEYNKEKCRFTITGLGVTLKDKRSPIVSIKNDVGEEYGYTVARINGQSQN